MVADFKIKASKNYISNLQYYVAFFTRNHRNIFNKDENKTKDNIDIFKTNIEDYLIDNDISILEYDFNEGNGDLVILKVLVPPLLSPTEVAFNIKKKSAPGLIKNNKDSLRGEHAIWTRQYAISNDKESVIELIKSKQ